MTVEIGVRAFRNRLSYWLHRAADGEEIIVTERGRPHVRVTATDWEDPWQRLIDEGIITPAKRPKRPIDMKDAPKLSEGTLTDILIDQRRSRDY